MNKSIKVILIILVVIALVVGGYFGYQKYQEYLEEERIKNAIVKIERCQHYADIFLFYYGFIAQTWVQTYFLITLSKRFLTI